MKLLKKYKYLIKKFIIYFLLVWTIYYIGKTTTGLRTSLILGILLLISMAYLFYKSKSHIIKLKEKYGDLALRLSKEVLQKINSLFIGIYGLTFILGANLTGYLNYFPFNELSYISLGILRGYIEYLMGFTFIICARLSFDRNKNFPKILYPLLGLSGLYLIFVNESLFTLFPLIFIGFLSYNTRDVLVRESFIYSSEESVLGLGFALFSTSIYIENASNYQIFSLVPPVYKIVYFIILLVSLFVLFYFVLRFVKKSETMMENPNLEEYRLFLENNSPTGSTTAALGLLNDKYIYYYKNKEGEKLLAFLYQIVNNKIIVMGEPIGQKEYFDEGLNEFLIKCEKLSLNPVFYEVGEKFTLSLHDYGFDFIKYGENAFVDLDEFSLAGRKKSSLRNILNRFEKDGYRFEILDPPYDDDLLKRLKTISDKWLKNREEKGFSMGFFDKYYLNSSRLALVYDRDNEVTAFTNIMPNSNPSTVTIDLMRYDVDMNVNSMMDYLFLNLFIKAKEDGCKFFNLGMAPLANVGIYKSSYLSERIAYIVYKHADSLYPFKGLRNYKSKYASHWVPVYTAFAKGNMILPSMISILAANKGQLIEEKAYIDYK